MYNTIVSGELWVEYTLLQNWEKMSERQMRVHSDFVGVETSTYDLFFCHSEFISESWRFLRVSSRCWNEFSMTRQCRWASMPNLLLRFLHNSIIQPYRQGTCRPLCPFKLLIRSELYQRKFLHSSLIRFWNKFSMTKVVWHKFSLLY